MTGEGADDARQVPCWGMLHAVLLLCVFVTAQVAFSVVFGQMARGLTAHVLTGAATMAVQLPVTFSMVRRLAGGLPGAAERLGLRASRPGSFWRALGIAGAGALAFVAVGLAMVWLSQLAGRSADEFPAQPLARLISAQGPGWTLVAAAVLTTVGAPMTEELLFRSVLYQPLRSRTGPVPAALAIGVVFALLHGYAWGLPQLLVLSLVFTALFEQTGSLWYPILAHGLYNGITLVVVRAMSVPDFSAV
ncbi:MAG: CPBP family intramembrane metalloprotease [Candidatus Brocadiaceae bacterium]|nr:CPBP family intramembrane metalloprotease [Candidatus Brocadiaceae bacterium]